MDRWRYSWKFFKFFFLEIIFSQIEKSHFLVICYDAKSLSSKIHKLERLLSQVKISICFPTDTNGRKDRKRENPSSEGGARGIQWTRLPSMPPHIFCFVGQKKTSWCNRQQQQQTMWRSIFSVGTALRWVIVWHPLSHFSLARFFLCKFSALMFFTWFSFSPFLLHLCARMPDWRHRCFSLFHFFSFASHHDFEMKIEKVFRVEKREKFSQSMKILCRFNYPTLRPDVTEMKGKREILMLTCNRIFPKTRLFNLRKNTSGI